MDIPRVIPLLLLLEDTFVKTRDFADPRYVGDPTNVINLFNRFEVDEIALLDIGATASGREPQYDLVRELAAECWVPLSYGGGVRSLEHARRLFASGAEKVIIGAAAAELPDLPSEIAGVYGAQAVVVSVDVRPSAQGYQVVVRNGSQPVATDPGTYARNAVESGAGEILLNAVHRDGTWEGYDLDLIGLVSQAVPVPVIAAGGAGSRQDLRKPIQAGAAAVAAGSLFVFSGPGGGVLVNFPARPELEVLMA
jgi:cyclase